MNAAARRADDAKSNRKIGGTLSIHSICCLNFSFLHIHLFSLRTVRGAIVDCLKCMSFIFIDNSLLWLNILTRCFLRHMNVCASEQLISNSCRNTEIDIEQLSHPSIEMWVNSSWNWNDLLFRVCTAKRRVIVQWKAFSERLEVKNVIKNCVDSFKYWFYNYIHSIVRSPLFTSREHKRTCVRMSFWFRINWTSLSSAVQLFIERIVSKKWSWH